MNGQQPLWNKLTSRLRKWFSFTVSFEDTDVTMPYLIPRPKCLSEINFSSVRCGYVPFRLTSTKPKCLPEINCSSILCGVRPEDYSADCWLEEHLHRFSSIAWDRPAAVVEESSSSNVDESVFSNSDSDSIPYINPYQYGLTENCPEAESSPPPYWDEPPPTYEEAVRSQDRDMQGEFSSRCTTPVYHESDFMW